MKRALFFSFFLSLGACTINSSRVASQVVVQVNDHTMTTKELGEKMARQLKNLDALSAKDPANVNRIKDEIIRNFILGSIISDFAKRQNISVQESELEKAVNEVRANYPDDLAFRRILAEENISFSHWKNEIKQSLIDQKVFQKINEKSQKPTDEEVRKFYNENKERFKRKERVYLLQIVTDDLAKGQTIRDELNKKKSFSQLAEKYSVSPEAKMGGVVGWIERGAVDIFDKAFTLPVGGISNVLESSYGFHIFKVERKAPEGLASLDEVRGQILQSLQVKKEQAEFTGWLDKQIRQSKIYKNNTLIQAIKVDTRGKI